MKRLLILCILSLLLIGTVACDNNDKKADILLDEVMAIHDEAMPINGKLYTLSGKLNVAADSVADSTRAADMREAAKQALEAHDAMMVWMREFKLPEELEGDRNDEKTIEYLEGEKKKMSDIKVQMEEALKQAQAFE